MEERTGSILTIREFLATCGSDSLRGRESLPFGQDGSLSCEMKAATLCLQRAMTLGRIGLKFSIDLPDSGNGLFGVATGVRGFVGVAFAHEVERMMKDEL
jgi:hypothetical protein